MSIARLLPEAVKYLVVHCSATPGNRNLGVADIDRMHRLRGFVKVGYHFVIKRDGVVEPGRGLNERGAHVEGHNHESIGVCLIGGVDAKLKPQNNFTPLQFAALGGVIEAFLAEFPNAQVVGHRDLPGVKKDCPCFDVKTWWAGVNS